MVTYYITYDDPPPRRRPSWFLILAILAVIMIAGATAALIWIAADDEDSPAVASPPATDGPTTDSSPTSAGLNPTLVPFVAAIPAVYQENTNTLFLVDVSESIAESGNLEPMRIALESIALGNAHPDIYQAVENSRVGLITFSDVPETVIELGPLHDDEARRKEWLAAASALQTESGSGTFIYDAVARAHEILSDNTEADGKAPVIVLLSDGIDGAVGECRPATANDGQSDYCVGESGDPVRCDDLPGGRGSSRGFRNICKKIPSDTSPHRMLQQLTVGSQQDGLTVHAIAYGSAEAHDWLRRAAETTGGRYIHAGH